MSPLLAQSGHSRRGVECPLSEVKANIEINARNVRF